jgi:hypothetical protein
MLGWLAHTLNISATLHGPKRHPSAVAARKIVSTVLIAAAA